MNDINDFIIDVENSAKKILRESNKKLLEENRKENLNKLKQNKLENNKRNEKNNNKILISNSYSFEKNVQEKVFGSSFNVLENDFKDTKVLNYSIPRMTIGLNSNETINLLDDPLLSSSGKYNNNSNSYNSFKSSQLSPIKTRPTSSSSPSHLKKTKLSNSLPSLEQEKALRQSALLKKLENSPFQPSAETIAREMGKGNKPVKNITNTNTNTNNNNNNKHEVKETDWALRQHAAGILSGKVQSNNANKIYQQSLNKLQTSSSSPSLTTSTKNEIQGPIDWSSRGLYEKYRNVDNRELAWSTYMDATSYVDTQIYENEKQLIPIAIVSRHPVMGLYFDRITQENLVSRQKTLARLKMKRFVQNIHEIWLTNLQHLKEHQVENLYQKYGYDSRNGSLANSDAGDSNHSNSNHGSNSNNNSNRGSSNPDILGINSGNNSSGTGNQFHIPRGKGLKDRRDNQAILNMSSQIQSVSHHRAMKNSYYTTRMGEPQVRLDYVITPCPKHDITLLLPSPPLLQQLVHQTSGFVTNQSNIPFVVTIDRLIPPFQNDLTLISTLLPILTPRQIQKLTTNSIWRISLIRTNHQLLQKTHYLTETEVNTFVSELESTWYKIQSNNNNNDDNNNNNNNINDNNEIQLFYMDELDIVWGNNIDLNCSLSVSYRYIGNKSLFSLSSSNHKDNNILLVIKAEFKQDYVGIDTIPLIINPIEFCSLLGIQELPPMNESFIEWFQDTLNEDDIYHFIWDRLTSQIYFLEGYEDSETGDPLPTHLAIRSFEEDIALKYQEQNYLNSLSNNIDINTNNSKFQTTVSSTALAIYHGYLLLSLLQVTDELEISLHNISINNNNNNNNLKLQSSSQSSIIQLFQPTFVSTTSHFLFEELSDVINNLSLRVSGGELLLKQIPGASPVGSMGIWHKYPLHKERTQASAIYYRNPQISSTDTVLVNLTLALDTSVLTTPFLTWEPHSEYPPSTIHDPVDGIIPLCTIYPNTLLNEEFISSFDKQTTPIVHIFNTTPIEGIDYPDPEPYRSRKKKNPKGFTRYLPLRSDNGFRNQIVENLLATDPSLPTIVFGITRLGAVPNATAVHTRSVWHSCVAINGNVNRLRGSIDYHYVLRNELSRGPNDPACFTIRFFGYGNRDLFRADVVCSAFESMEKQYKEIQDERDIFARENSLASKIEASEIILKTKQKQYELLLRKRTQLSIEKRMRKASKTERGWRRRFEFSVSVAQQGDWEQRLDQRANIYFFHRLNEDPETEIYSETCQWEVPVTWSGDLLLTADQKNQIKDTLDPSLKLEGQATTNDSAFSQPNEIWLPHNHEIHKGSHMNNDRTPGVKSTGVIRSGQNKGGSRVGTGGQSLTGFSSSISKSSIQLKDGIDNNNNINNDNSNIKQNYSTASGIAEELLLNDDIVYALAKRLGLSTEKIVPASQLPSVFSMSQDDLSFQQYNSSLQTNSLQEDSGILAPRLESIDETNDVEDPKYDSDDDLWSDDERLVGDVNDEHEQVESFLPQNHSDVKKFNKIQQELLGNAGMDLTKKKSPKKGSAQSRVPDLNLAQKVFNGQDPHAMNQGVIGWRKLPRPEIPAKFFQKCTQTRTLGPDVESLANKPNNPVFLIPLSPVDACQYEPMTFSVDIESIFIPDARKDMDRVLANIERNIEREEQLSKNIPTDELLLFGKADAMTSVDNFVAHQYKMDKELNLDPKQEAIEKAILAAKTSNIAEMEDALEEDISIDTTDQYGNTLLILAAQQGSKRMCKYLLRRGANINAQSLTGQTPLHYCYAYSHHELGDYLKTRGADDSILNAEKLTCYEGLSTSGTAAIV